MSETLSNRNAQAVRLLDDCRHRLVGSEPRPLDVAAVKAALDVAGPNLFAQLDRLARTYDEALRAFGAATAAAHVLPAVTSATVAVEVAGAVFPQQAELEATADLVAELRGELDRAQAQVREAAAAGGLVDVMALREGGAVALPERLAAAEMRLLELQVAEAETRLAPARRGADAERQAAAAEQTISAAEQAVVDAKLRLENLRRLEQGLNLTAREVALARLREELDSAAQRRATRARRVLELAGLSDLAG